MKTLNERMKDGELYVVFSGIDEDFSLRFIGYGDPTGTPRIYSKDTLDPRVSNQLQICKSVETANKRLGPKTFAVMLPLSAMIEYYTDFEVRRWALPQRSVSPSEVREYVLKWVATRSSGSRRDLAADRDFYTKQIVFDHGKWIASHPNGTLGDLLDHLETVRFEMLQYDSDDLIADHIEDLVDAAEYLSCFDDPSEPLDDDGDLPSFAYRLENVDEDILHVDELFELVGESFSVSDLPSLEDLLSSRSLELVG